MNQFSIEATETELVLKDGSGAAVGTFSSRAVADQVLAALNAPYYLVGTYAGDLTEHQTLDSLVAALRVKMGNELERRFGKVYVVQGRRLYLSSGEPRRLLTPEGGALQLCDPQDIAPDESGCLG